MKRLNTKISLWILLPLVLLIPCSSVLALECVVLLHGLARTENSMNKMAKALNDADYVVVNHHYPSRSDDVLTLAKEAIPKAIENCPEGVKINFVTHSMGGILIRAYLEYETIEDLNRVVMLGPPSHGSEVVDKLAWMPGFKLINGPAGMELGTDEESVPQALKSVNFPLGVIAGNASVNPILSRLIPAEDDGKVSVENAKVEGMTDNIVIFTTHPFMMRNKEVIEQTLYFLEHEKFSYSLDNENL